MSARRNLPSLGMQTIKDLAQSVGLSESMDTLSAFNILKTWQHYQVFQATTRVGEGKTSAQLYDKTVLNRLIILFRLHRCGLNGTAALKKIFDNDKDFINEFIQLLEAARDR